MLSAPMLFHHLCRCSICFVNPSPIRTASNKVCASSCHYTQGASAWWRHILLIAHRCAVIGVHHAHAQAWLHRYRQSIPPPEQTHAAITSVSHSNSNSVVISWNSRNWCPRAPYAHVSFWNCSMVSTRRLVRCYSSNHSFHPCPCAGVCLSGRCARCERHCHLRYRGTGLFTTIPLNSPTDFGSISIDLQSPR